MVTGDGMLHLLPWGVYASLLDRLKTTVCMMKLVRLAMR